MEPKVLSGGGGGGEGATAPPPFINTDLTSTRQEYYFSPPAWIDAWLLRQLRDPRDTPLAYLLFNIIVLVVPAAVATFVAPPSHALGAAYLVLSNGLFLQRFLLGLHYAEHLQIFKSGLPGAVLNSLCPYFLCALFGLPPGMYRLHHIYMHHCENNLFPHDLSSTEVYQRDNFFHWLLYWLRFWVAIWVELPLYALRKRRLRLAAHTLVMLAAFAAVVRQLWLFNHVATIWVVAAPMLVASLAMMFGNWAQHLFLDPARPRSNYALTYNLVNAADNLKTFNDGYHIVHHQNSKLHWTELPLRFMQTLDKHAHEDALVFEGLGFFDVGFLAMTGQLHKLADRYVDIGQKRRSREELVAMLKERLRPIRASARHQGADEQQGRGRGAGEGRGRGSGESRRR